MEGRAGPWGGSNVHVSPETLANASEMPCLELTESSSSVSLEEQGTDPWFFWEEGMRENSMLEAWPEKMRWG